MEMFTIATGTFPRTHGMVADNWWDTGARRLIECTDDDQSPVVTYGRASKLGKSARNSMAPSLADELRGQRPGARVVTLSMKARSAIGLAGHGGDAVTWFEEGAGVGSFVTSRTFSTDQVPAVRTFLARDSFENLLFGVCRFRERAGHYPDTVTVVSWGFKAARFDLHRETLRWPASH